MGTFTPELTFGSYSYGTMSESPGILYKTIQIGDQPSLNFDFTAGVLDSKITFTRASSGTYFNSSGVLTTASANTARFSYDPATFMAQGLLVEEQRTNLLLRSEEFDNASWGKTGATVTANAVTSPDGTMDADKLVESSATESHYLVQAATMVAGTSYTQTVFAKAGERSVLQITSSTNMAGGGLAYQNFDLSSGALGGSSGGKTASIQNCGNGWYRCSFTDTAIASTSGQFIVAMVSSSASARLASYTGDGTSGIYLWGAQLEAGSFATSYIPTVASQVTRTADVATITGANFSQFYNQSEGTFVVEAATQKPTSLAATVIAIDASDGGINNRHYIGVVSASAEVRTVNGGSVQSTITQAYSANSVEKYAYAVKANDFAFARNGSIVGTDTSGSMPTINRMFIGNAAGSAAYFNGHIRRITYYPTRLSNAQLQALTA